MQTICKFSLSIFLTFCLFSQLAAQSVWSYVPSNAGFVMTADFDHLGKKVTMADLRKIDFIEHFLQEEVLSMPGKEGEMVRDFLNDPAKLGLDISQPLCLFMSKEGDYAYVNFLVKLKSSSTFEEMVFNTLKQPDDVLIENETYNLFVNNGSEQSIAWNNDILAWSFMIDMSFLNRSATTLDGYEDMDQGPGWMEEEEMVEEEPMIEEEMEEEPMEIPELPTEEMEEEQVEPEPLYEEIPNDYNPIAEQLAVEAKKYELLGNWVEKLMNRKFLMAISSDENFRNAVADRSDMHFWMNYDWFMQLYGANFSSGMGMVDRDAQKLAGILLPMMEMFYADTYVSFTGNFNDGMMEFKSKMFYNEDISAFYKKALDAKLNKRMLRYVKDDGELFGYFFMNMSIKNSIDEGKKLLYKVLDNTPQYGDMAKDAVKILGIVIDEEAIGNVMKGDLMLAVSGMQSMQVTQQTYEFDEDFNMVTKDTTILQDLPVVTMLMSYGSKKDLMKFIDLGIHSGAIQEEGRYFSVTVPKVGIKFYMALENGLFIVTNDSKLVQSNLATGYAKSKRLGKQHRKTLCKSGSVMYWDISHTLRVIAGSQMGQSPSVQPILERMASEIKSLDAFNNKFEGNSLDGEVHLHLFDESENFLIKVLQIVNEFYLESAGDART